LIYTKDKNTANSNNRKLYLMIFNNIFQHFSFDKMEFNFISA